MGGAWWLFAVAEIVLVDVSAVVVVLAGRERDRRRESQVGAGREGGMRCEGFALANSNAGLRGM